MKATKRQRHKQESAEIENARKFADYPAIWIKQGGDLEALDWLARHVGRQDAKVKSLERRVAALERSAAKNKGARK